MLVFITIAALLSAAGVRGEEGLSYEEPFGTVVGRQLLTLPSIDAIRTSCRTKASASLRITRGRARVKAKSTCAAFAGSINNIEETVKEYLKNVRNKPRNYCTTVKIEEVIQACAKAIAKVYTEASVDIRVRGDARVCASARSEGDAYAQAYAALLINLWLGTTTGENSAEADAKAQTLTFALSKAWAKAKTAKCQKGTGRVRGFDVSFASQVRVAITCVTVELVTTICDVAIKKAVELGKCNECSNGELAGLLTKTESSSEIGVCSKTVEVENIKRGDAKTENRKSVKCSGKKSKCCADEFDGASECLCGRGCFLKRTVSGLWLNPKSNKLCYCPNYEVLPFDEAED